MFHFQVIVAALLSCSGLFAAPQPVSAFIEGKTLAGEGSITVGNVRVRFSDGHTERWTKLGQCHDPKVSAAGHVGWCRYQEIDPVRLALRKASVRVRLPDGTLRDFDAAFERFIIEKWCFADHDSTLVIVSSNEHSLMWAVKFDLRSGEVVEAVSSREKPGDRPAWSKGYLPEW
ncbi:hypothetical protein llg_42050 [Luteolibacter sp. LG18]|nr:hypothetical protein llg_42050 [Luteolibacter sp. LG18]